jgi:hypothetical protein
MRDKITFLDNIFVTGANYVPPVIELDEPYNYTPNNGATALMINNTYCVNGNPFKFNNAYDVAYGRNITIYENNYAVNSIQWTQPTIPGDLHLILETNWRGC